MLTKLGLKAVPGNDFDPEYAADGPAGEATVRQCPVAVQCGKQLHDNNPPLISDQDFADLQTAWDVAKTLRR